MCIEREKGETVDGAELPPAVLADDVWLREWRGRPLEPADADRLLASLCPQPSSN
jgi:hypothetical protein